MMKIAICDDEPFMLDQLSSMLTNYANVNWIDCQISRHDSGGALLKNVEVFDALFLDIQMEPPDGMETARQLRARGCTGPLIFTTVLKEAVFDSFELNAFDFLVKPIEAGRFARTMDRVVRAIEDRDRKSLMVQKQGVCQVVPFAQILYCEVISRKIYLHRQGGEVIDYYEKMETLNGQLDRRFFRCHRSYLVNLDHVLGCKDGLAALSDGSEIPVSRLREPDLIHALLLRMKEGRHGLV